MAAAVGPIVFVVVVVGGLGSLAGAFVASLLIGMLQTFAVARRLLARRPASARFGVTVSAGSALLGRSGRVTIAQIAPILPYLLLVLILIFRPHGPARDARRHERASRNRARWRRRRCRLAGGAGAAAASWIAAALLFAVLPLRLPSGAGAHAAEPDGHRDRLRALVQHAARADRHAVVRARGLLRARRLLRRARA